MSRKKNWNKNKKENWNNKYKWSNELPDMSYEFLGDAPYTTENMKEITMIMRDEYKRKTKKKD